MTHAGHEISGAKLKRIDLVTCLDAWDHGQAKASSAAVPALFLADRATCLRYFT
jgi:hypothetical protein